MIYADCAAQRPPLKEAVEAVKYALCNFGNPSGVHEAASRAASLLFESRKKTAAAIGAAPSDIIFTSSGTESDNMAVFSAVRQGMLKGRNKIIVSAIEHSAVLNAAFAAQRLYGAKVELIPCLPDGTVDISALEKMADTETCVVSVMTANNETGVIQPVKAAADIARKCGALFHTDAVQAAGMIPIDVKEIGCDMLSISAHKFGGMAGAGALYVKNGTAVTPLLYGGGQEKGKRAGTQAVPAVYAMGEALTAACSKINEKTEYVKGLRDALQKSLEVDGIVIVGKASQRLPGTLCICVSGKDGEALALKLGREGICVSSGAACSTGSDAVSGVLTAMGIDTVTAKGALRISLCEENTAEEIQLISQAIKALL